MNTSKLWYSAYVLFATINIIASAAILVDGVYKITYKSEQMVDVLMPLILFLSSIVILLPLFFSYHNLLLFADSNHPIRMRKWYKWKVWTLAFLASAFQVILFIYVSFQILIPEHERIINELEWIMVVLILYLFCSPFIFISLILHFLFWLKRTGRDVQPITIVNDTTLDGHNL